MRSDRHEHVGKALHCDTKGGSWSVFPFVEQPVTVDATDVDRIESTGYLLELSIDHTKNFGRLAC